MGQVADILDRLASGKLDTGQAADRLRRVKPRDRPRPEATGLMSLGQDDPGGWPVEDDGHEITDAFHDGKITNAQTTILGNALFSQPQR